MKKTIDWTIFEGSSHCEEGLADFAMGNIKTYKEFIKYFLPHMKKQAKEVEKLSKLKIGIKKSRQLAARAFKRFSGLSVTEAYN